MHPLFTRSVHVTKLIELFKTLSIEAPISFTDASRKLGFEISSTSSAYHAARKIATKECDIVVEGIRKFGFMRLSGSGIVKRSNSHDSSLRRRARKAGTEMAVAIGQNLNREEAQTATEKLSRYRIIADLSGPANAASNRHVVEEPAQQAPPDIRANLRAIK